MNVFCNGTCSKAAGIRIFWNHMFCMDRNTKWNNLTAVTIPCLCFWITSCCHSLTDANRFIPNPLLDPYYIIEENTQLRIVSGTFCAQNNIESSRLGNSCRNLVRIINILKKTCKNKAILARSCKISARIMHSLGKSCKNFILFSKREVKIKRWWTKKSYENCKNKNNCSRQRWILNSEWNARKATLTSLWKPVCNKKLSSCVWNFALFTLFRKLVEVKGDFLLFLSHELRRLCSATRAWYSW